MDTLVADREASTSEIVTEDLPEKLDLPLDEAVALGGIDADFYAHTWMPKTFRFPSAAMHKRIWFALENPAWTYINLPCFRGSAKTTILRTFVSRRIAYRVSRTIMFLGGSETKASQSLQWVRSQVERNKLWTANFGLRPGRKWTETELEIISDIDGSTTWLVAAGLTSSFRGVNFEDYRPDLIVCDDLLNDENVLTQEARTKVNDLVLGAVALSLASRVEFPNAKLAVLQTPMAKGDVTSLLSQSEAWHTEKFGCWSEETMDLPLDQRESAWPESYPSTELRQQKRDAAAMGKLSVFLREMEVTLTSPETAVFRSSLLQYYDATPSKGTTILAIDPVPPPTTKTTEKKILARRDFEAFVVMKRVQGNYYLLHYELHRGHDPSWTLAKFFELAQIYRINFVAVEVVAYQAVLKWLLEKEMVRRGQYYSLLPDNAAGNKSKYQRIVDSIGPLLQHRKLYVNRNQTEFLAALEVYPSVETDDLLDAVSIALRALINPTVELGEGEYNDDSEYSPLLVNRRCP